MKRMFTRKVYEQRRLYWQDVLVAARDWSVAVLVIMAWSYLILDGIFPNTPLQ